MKTLKATVCSLLFVMMIAGTAFSQTPQTEVLRQIGAATSAERIEADITKLVSFDTRHTLSDTTSETEGIGAARRWLKEEFERISADCGGCLEVFYVRDYVGGENRIPEPVEIVNVVAIQRGTADPNRFVMMSGDIDSRVSDVMDGESTSPGANDNASGVAGVLEAARVLSQYEFEGSIMYAQLSGEEQGLFGGQILAEHAKEQGWDIKGVLNNDMIGNIQGINGVIDNTTARVFSEGTRAVETEREARIRRFTGGEVDSPSRNLARYVDKMADLYIRNLDVMMIYRLDRFGRGGHHRPFNDVGFPAVRIMETNEDYNRQHQDLRTEDGVEYGDVLSEVEFDFAAKLTGLNAVTMAAMSWAPSPPAEVQISGAVRPSATLSWKALDPEENPQLAGYKIYWRLTDANQWQKSEFVPADVTEHTLENVVIDNYYFGVASVSKDGFESPVVFPGPAGSFGD
ncbi:MAG: peptidase M28 [Balneola sp.]|nr:peptidase M28 [Balneola sp.]|tara:strand:- start:53109 stop:54482 length:1374 start_codon:yes stop_codon:yes gene_type:complete